MGSNSKIDLDRGVILAKKFAAARRRNSSCTSCGQHVAVTDRVYFRWRPDGKALESILCGHCADSQPEVDRGAA